MSKVISKDMFQNQVMILDKKWNITFKERPDPGMETSHGWCDPRVREIVVITHDPDMALPKEYLKQTLRHELLHAFFFTLGHDFNGLTFDGSWSTNEEMIQFMAVNIPRLVKIYREVGCL